MFTVLCRKWTDVLSSFIRPIPKRAFGVKMAWIVNIPFEVCLQSQKLICGKFLCQRMKLIVAPTNLYDLVLEKDKNTTTVCGILGLVCFLKQPPGSIKTQDYNHRYMLHEVLCEHKHPNTLHFCWQISSDVP